MARNNLVDTIGHTLPFFIANRWRPLWGEKGFRRSRISLAASHGARPRSPALLGDSAANCGDRHPGHHHPDARARQSEQRLREVLVRAGDNHCAWFRKEADITIDWSHFRQPGQIEEGK